MNIFDIYMYVFEHMYINIYKVGPYPGQGDGCRNPKIPSVWPKVGKFQLIDKLWQDSWGGIQRALIFTNI